MARTTPPSIDPVPTPPIQRGDRATFSSRVDAFILWLVNAVTQFRAVALNVYDNAVDAFQSATSSAADKVATAADRVQTGQDRTQTGQDRVQTGQDRAAAQAAAQQAGNAGAFLDTNPVVKGSGDQSKLLRFEIDGYDTATTRVATMPNKNGTVAMLDDIPTVTPSGLVLLATITPTAVASIDFATVFNSAYDNYLIVGNRVSSANANVNATLYARAIEAGSPITANYITSALDGVAPAEATSTVAQMSIGPGAQTGFEIFVSRFGSNALFLFESTGRRLNNNTGGILQARYLNKAVGSSSIAGIRFYWSDAVNFTATGMIRVYGISRT